jgi:hypothetical protein
MMANDHWTWANLSKEKIDILQEGERTLGSSVDLLLAFQGDSIGIIGEDGFRQNKFELARISDSQIECLRGLEKKISATVIAYHQAK